MKFYAIRHGETDWNVAGRLQGSTDVELNENGIRQAQEARDIIAKYPVDLIVCSTMKRAKKTAEIINEALHCEILYTEDLCERCYGEFEGMTAPEYRADPMMAAKAFSDYAANVHYRGVEPIHDFCERIKKLIDGLRESYPGKNILLVTHGATMRAIDWYFHGLDEDGKLPNSKRGNCTIFEFSVE